MLAAAAAASLGLAVLIAGLDRFSGRSPRLAERAEFQNGACLTVVLPVYDEAANIEACLASMLASEAPCPRWRVLVVDDRSSDATAALARAMETVDSEWVLFVDADVRLAPTALAALALALLGIVLQLALRLWTGHHFALSLRHWWLMGAGGLVVMALGPTSVWRTLTGRGWTWKGRALA